MRASAAVMAVCLCGCARAQGAAVVVPPRQPPAAAARATAGGRGDVELGLGVVTAAVAGVLVGVGSYEAWRAVRVRSYCTRPDAFDDPHYDGFCTTALGQDPFVPAVVSSSLSFVFAVPIAVASGLLLRRGVADRRAWRAAGARGNLSIRPWSNGQGGAGLTLGLRF